MKRTPLRRKKYYLKRSRLRSKTVRGQLLKECDRLFRKIVFRERISRCEWCKGHFRLQIAHILPKGLYPRLRYSTSNVLLLCFPCHPPRWHKNPLEAAKFVEEYKGEGYRDWLLCLDKTSEKLTNTRLNFLIASFKKILGE